MWKKIKLLEYHSDLLTMTVDIHLGICDVGSLKEDFSPGRLLKEIQGTDECRFTTAGWSDNGYYFTSAIYLVIVCFLTYLVGRLERRLRTNERK